MRTHLNERVVDGPHLDEGLVEGIGVGHRDEGVVEDADLHGSKAITNKINKCVSTTSTKYMRPISIY